MSNITEQIKNVFQKYGIDPTSVGIKFEDEAAVDAAKEITFAVEGTLTDGTKIYSTAAEWVAGVDIYTQDADGNPVAVPAGEYVLEDGTTKVVVGEDGMVAEITTQEAEVEMSSEDVVAMITSLSERIAAIENEKTELAAQLDAAKSEVSTVKAELASVKKAPAAHSIKSQEFKKNALPVHSGNSFSEFMDTLRAKKK